MNCGWDGQFCEDQGACWNYPDSSSCDTISGCSWQLSLGQGWCEEVGCWNWDSWRGGTNSSCLGNASFYNLSCVWESPGVFNESDGWCFTDFDMTCSNLSTERECMDTYYCFWQYVDWNDVTQGGSCNDPLDLVGFESGGFFESWNPGCYIFDENETKCNLIIGCEYSGGLCNPEDVADYVNAVDIIDSGINCSLVNDSSLCGSIPVLSSCCEWKSGGCSENKMSNGCWDDLEEMAVGGMEISACQDVSAVTADSASAKTLCENIANDPWYMPCKWDNTTYTCGCNADNIFGNRTQSFALINNQKTCEACGGKWIIDNYCEGNLSVPSGRCEQKGDSETNCDKACFACEYKFGGSIHNSSQEAEEVCYGSDLGYCEFINNTDAPNGYGFCKSKPEFKQGTAGNCKSDCGSCTFMGNPHASSYSSSNPSTYDVCNTPKCFCENTNEFGNVKCKWVDDSLSDEGGYCVDSTEKICEDACDRCYTRTSCFETGRSAFNATGTCEWMTSSGEASTSESEGSCQKTGQTLEICWDAVDNDNDGLVDCADSGCFSDSACGFVSGDCFGWASEENCIGAQLDNGLNCTWINDSGVSWCDFPGSDCWKYDGNESVCGGKSDCNWSAGFGTGWCEQDWSLGEDCYTAKSASSCEGLGDCSWTNDTWCDTSDGDSSDWCTDQGGWCDPSAFAPKGCWNHDDNEIACNETLGCFWDSDGEYCMEQGCWNYDSNSTECAEQDNCDWETDEWGGMCQVDWSMDCWKYDETNETYCETQGCSWQNDSYGTWCDNKFSVCWDLNVAQCALETMCGWNDWAWNWNTQTQGMCDAGCFDGTLIENECTAISGCTWSDGWCMDSSMAGGSGGVDCWQYDSNQTECSNISGCNWKSPGWCDPTGFSGGGAASGGGGGGSAGIECWKYDGNEASCTNSTLIGIGCSWMTEFRPFCEPDWSSDCWQYDWNSTACDNSSTCYWVDGYCANVFDECFMNNTLMMDEALCDASANCNWSTGMGGQCEIDWNLNCPQYDETNETYCEAQGCSWQSDDYGTRCDVKFMSCWDSYSSEDCSLYPDTCSWNGFMCEPICFGLDSATCSDTGGCTNQTGHCEPSCFASQTQNECTGNCGWIDGWCNPPGMATQFGGMELGAPVMIAFDDCDPQKNNPQVDLCGIGIKDMDNNYGIGAGVADFSNAGICNNEKIGFGNTFGSGDKTIKFYVYLDSDGSQTGGCALSDDSSAVGYEFLLKYIAEWNNTLSKAVESFTAYKCGSDGWVVADIGLGAWKQKMCGEIMGPMISIDKNDLKKFSSLYDSNADLRIYAAMANESGSANNPSDSVGPGWITPGAIDFQMTGFFEYGANGAQFEDIMQKGYVEYEDCFNQIDDDDDGLIDCYDWNCEYAPHCLTTDRGVDTSMPILSGLKVEEYPDAALIMYNTNKVTNGTLTFWYNDSSCSSTGFNRTIFDSGINNDNVKEKKLWHMAQIYNDTGINSLDYGLENGTTYYYKINICDTGGKCSVSACTSFKTAESSAKCGYCDFVTRLKSPSEWDVYYDLDSDGSYEHHQGFECGPNSGMKTNYTTGRTANIKMNKSDGSVYFEFLNVTLTKTGLTNDIRTISGNEDLIYDSGSGYVGMPADTRDKIINNMFPEACRIKIPSSGVCDKLYHCDDSGANCVDRTLEATLVDSTNCVWQLPYCEFSTWDEDGNPSAADDDDDDDGGSSGGGGGGAGGAVFKVYVLTNEQFSQGYTKSLGKGDKMRINISGETHYVISAVVSNTSLQINVTSSLQQATLYIGDEKKFDVSGDGIYDLSVKLNSINATSLQAEITVQPVSGEVIEEEQIVDGEVVDVVDGVVSDDSVPVEEKGFPFGILITIIIVVVILGVVVYFVTNKKGSKK